MSIKILNSVILMGMMLFTACTKKSDAKSPALNEGVSGAPDAPDFRSVLAQSLAGNWFGPCEDVSINKDPLIKSKQIKLIATGFTFVESTSFFRDTACQRSVSRLDFTYELQAAVASTAFTSQIDLELKEYRLTPLTSEVASDYNARAVCGLTGGWYVFQPRVVTSLECEAYLNANSGGQMAGTIRYDILKTDDAQSPTTVAFGNLRSGDGSTNAKRPVSYQATVLSRP